MRRQKFKSAEEKRRFLENQTAWDKLSKKYVSKTIVPKNEKFIYRLENPPGRDRLDVPSLNTNGGSTALREQVKYTGDKMVGISIIHKSCLQPIFNEDAAKDVASMRR